MKIHTDATFYKDDDGLNYQRSSALKSFEACNWLYYCNYVLKLPQGTNDGALKGTVCHTFFECLLHTRHKDVYKVVMKEKTITASKAATKLVKKLMKKHGLAETEENFKHIDTMIIVGLSNDFYCKGAKIIGNEYRFKINNENPKYSIYGTMDKLSVKDGVLTIEDYKSSKKKYEGDEIKANVQALMYTLAAKKTWPHLKTKLRFIFLQFPENPFIEIEYSDEVLSGFEAYLEMIQKKVDSFSLDDAKNGFAFDKKRGENTFSGSLLCGYGKFPGHKNKDGKVYWVCPYKWAYDYWVTVKDGKIIHADLNKDNLEPKDGETIEKRKYDGCLRWSQPLNDMLPEVKKEVKKTVIWDF